MRKRVLSILLLAAAASSFLSGCSDNAVSGGAPQEGRKDGSAAPGKADPVKISIMTSLDTPRVPSDRLEKMLEAATNTELDIQWIPDGSYDEKVSASFETGTLPKAVFLKNAASLIIFRDAIRNGQFWEIGPLLGEYPNLSRLRHDVLMNASVGGRIYGLYQERPASRQGIIYRKDWADRLGLKAPSTIDELYVMLKRFTENDPDGNGRKDTIGLADRGDLVYGAFKTVSSYFGTPNGWGMQSGKLLPEFMFPAYMDTMNFFRRLHKEGLMNQAFPVTSKADQQELLTTGKAGLYIGTMGDVLGLNRKAQAINPGAELDVQNRIKGPKGYGIWASPGYGSVVLFPKTAIPTETDLKEVLHFFDRLMSPPLANLIYWGVEGTHYTLKDGRVVPSDDVRLTEADVRPYMALQIGGPDTIGGLLKADFQLQAKVKSDTLTADNDNILINDPTWPLDSDTYNMMGLRLQDIITDATYQYILGMIDEAGFKAAVDRWLKQGGSKIIEEFNEAYRQLHR